MTKLQTTVSICIFLLLFSTSACDATGSEDFLQGVTFGAMQWPAFSEELVLHNLIRLADIGCNSIILIVEWYVDDYSDPTIEAWHRDKPGFPNTDWFYPTLYDNEIQFVIRAAHDLGFSVMLKPHVETLDWPVSGLGRFALQADHGRWDELFDSYQEYMNYCARLCEQEGVEILSLGCELESMTYDAPEADRRWRRIIDEVRNLYSGQLTYSCAFHGPANRTWSSPNLITFWDALDYIGFELYRGLTERSDPSLQELREGVRDIFENFVEPLSRAFDRPVLIPEIDFRSFDGANMLPLGEPPPDSQPDHQEHADCYRAVLEVIDEIREEKDYLSGIYWWSGQLLDPAASYHQLAARDGAWLWGKPAEDVLRDHWEGTNGWIASSAAAEDLFVPVLPTAAARDGCLVDVRENEDLGMLLMSAEPADGWELMRWDGDVDVDLPMFPLTVSEIGCSESSAAFFRTTPCMPCSAEAIGQRFDLEESFWFAGGDAGSATVKFDESESGVVVTREFPASGSNKLALRFDPPFDARAYVGIQFSARSSRETAVWLEIASQDRGLHLLENGDDWKSSSATCSIQLAAEPLVFRFPFASFTDPPWLRQKYPDVTPGINRSAIWEIQFFPETGPVVIEILDVSFYSEP